jgi:hypothetical protein
MNERTGYPAWLLHAEEELDAVARVLEEAAEEPWQAEVHALVVDAWVRLSNHRKGYFAAARSGGTE